MIQGRYTRLDFRRISKRPHTGVKRRNTVKLVRKDEGKMKPSHVQVVLRIVGEGVEGKMKGKVMYQTFQSWDVEEATPNEVANVVYRALEVAQNRK